MKPPTTTESGGAPSPRSAPGGALALLLAVLAALALLVAGCGDDGSSDDAALDAEGTADDGVAEGEMKDGEASFPVEVDTATGPVTVTERPEAIVSLSPTATEMLYAIGAGDRVVAVDQYSNYPPETPEGTLDGFSPDLEAILATAPDLVVSQGLPSDVEEGLTSIGVVVLNQPPATTFDDTYSQLAELGLVTGEVDGAAASVAELQAGIEEVLASLPELESPVRVFHEIDDSFYTAASGSFIGQVYAEMGFENVADAAGDGTPYPLVDGESILAADPTLIVFTDQAPYGTDDIASRPGWETMTAVAEGNVVQVDGDVASRWGPRIVEFMEAVAAIVAVPA